jgi:hypothetical protein
MTADGVKGIHPWRQRVDYKAYQSKFGPQYVESIVAVVGDRRYQIARC